MDGGYTRTNIKISADVSLIVQFVLSLCVMTLMSAMWRRCKQGTAVT